MINSRLTGRFVKGAIYEITSKNTINETVYDSSVTVGDGLHRTKNTKRYSVYGIKLTDSCMNGIMEFLQAKASDPTHCVSELEVDLKNVDTLNSAKISFNQHNLRDKEKTFFLRTIDDYSNGSMPANNHTNDASSRQDIVVGVKFRSDLKKMISLGSINQKLMVMGNNESFDMTMKKIENQAQQREQSKAKYIKPSTAKKATTVSNITRRSSVPVVSLNGKKCSLDSVRMPPKVVTMRNTQVTRPLSLSTMTIRNISKPANVTAIDDSIPKSGVRQNPVKHEEFSLKDHVVFNLTISPLTIDELCSRVSKITDMKQTISKTTLIHLIKSSTTYDESTKTYSLIEKFQKTPEQLEKWPFYNEERNCRSVEDDKKINSLKISENSILCHDSYPSSKVNLPSNNLKRIKNEMRENVSFGSNKIKCNSPLTKQPKLSTKQLTKSEPKIMLEPNFDLNFDSETSIFADLFPPIKNNVQCDNYIKLYDKIHPLYSEKAKIFAKLSCKAKQLRQLHIDNPNDESIRQQYEEEERKLHSDLDFLDLYSDTEFLHSKLSYIENIVNRFDASCSSGDEA